MSDNAERTIRLILTTDDLEGQAQQLIELVNQERRAAAEAMLDRCVNRAKDTALRIEQTTGHYEGSYAWQVAADLTDVPLNSDGGA